jgi:hypothetical protein
MVIDFNDARVLTRDHLVALARLQAERHEPMEHHFEVGSPQACTFERAYHEKQRELRQELEG